MSFISLVIVVSNAEPDVAGFLHRLETEISSITDDWEIIIVDNASSSKSLGNLKKIVSNDSTRNTHLLALAKPVEESQATWLGFENSIGDFVVSLKCGDLDLSVLNSLKESAENGFEVVYGYNLNNLPERLSIRIGRALFKWVYQLSTGESLEAKRPNYKLLSRRVINFILQHDNPERIFRHLPSLSGFETVSIRYPGATSTTEKRRITREVSHGLQLLISSTSAPLRLATGLSLFGAFANVLYSIYVVYVAITNSHVAAGWVSTSLQNAGMFFLLSLVFFVFGEYLLHLSTQTSNDPKVFIASGYSSKFKTTHERLNVNEAMEN